MENTKHRLQSEARVSGIGGEIRRLGEGSSASVDELRQFIGQMRGKSPEEVMGAVANSGLTQGIVISTIGFAAALLVFTVVPYFVFGGKAAAEAARAATAAKANEKPAAAAEKPAGEGQAPPAAATETAAAPKSAAEQAVEKMGIGEAKTTDPNANPLDGNLDNLLDGVDKKK